MAPAYDYGYRSASDARYRGRSWSDVENDLRTDYERNYPNSAWEKDEGCRAVRLGKGDGQAVNSSEAEAGSVRPPLPTRGRLWILTIASELRRKRPEEVVIPVIEEELAAGVKAVKTGAVRVDKHVEKRIRKVEGPLLHEDVEVRRVPVNRVVSEAPPVRRKGDTVIVPVMEEELVVTKRLVLKEEVHLIKRRTKDRFVKEVEVNRERAEVHRLDADGRVIDRRAARTRTAARRSVLE